MGKGAQSPDSTARVHARPSTPPGRLTSSPDHPWGAKWRLSRVKPEGSSDIFDFSSNPSSEPIPLPLSNMLLSIRGWIHVH